MGDASLADQCRGLVQVFLQALLDAAADVGAPVAADFGDLALKVFLLRAQALAGGRAVEGRDPAQVTDRETARPSIRHLRQQLVDAQGHFIAHRFLDDATRVRRDGGELRLQRLHLRRDDPVDLFENRLTATHGLNQVGRGRHTGVHVGGEALRIRHRGEGQRDQGKAQHA